MANVADTKAAETMASPIERAVRNLETELVGHVDPETHAMSEYGIARMAVTVVLQSIRDPSEVMLRAGWTSDLPFTPSIKVDKVWQAMIDSLLANE
jgi:hypothetical protein